MVSVRKLVNNPVSIVGPHLASGMTALDIGSGMGFFTIPMAQIVGASGRVVAVDLQPEMLAGLDRNARRAGCDNITLQQCDAQSLGLGQWDDAIDFALMFYMLHEVPDPRGTAEQVCAALKPGGRALLAEPIVHVSQADFRRSVGLMTRAGLAVVDRPRIPISRAVVLQKRAAA